MTHGDLLGRDPKLAELVRRLVHAYQPESIYLFGSVARGDADADSDYDRLIIVPNDASPERRQSRLAYEVLRGTGAPVDALVCSQIGALPEPTCAPRCPELCFARAGSFMPLDPARAADTKAWLGG